MDFSEHGLTQEHPTLVAGRQGFFVFTSIFTFVSVIHFEGQRIAALPVLNKNTLQAADNARGFFSTVFLQTTFTSPHLCWLSCLYAIGQKKKEKSFPEFFIPTLTFV